MNQSSIVPFAFEDHLVRVIADEQGNPWFVAKDVARALDYEWKASATIGHVPEEWRGVYSVQTPSGIQEMLTFSEQGLYFFLGRSDKPGALPFQKWMAGDVMPSLRKTGTYTVPKQARRRVLPEGVPAEALLLRPTVRQRLWQDALQTARLDNAGTEAAQEWFVRLCQLMTCDSTKAEGEGLINAFMDQCLENCRGHTTSFSKIYAALQLWWDKNGIGPVPGTRRTSDMIGVRFHRHKSSVSTFRNCALRT